MKPRVWRWSRSTRYAESATDHAFRPLERRGQQLAVSDRRVRLRGVEGSPLYRNYRDKTTGGSGRLPHHRRR